MTTNRSTGPRALMSPAALHILMALAEGERHGYAVKQEIEERTGGELVLGPGTLYEAIHRMLRDGMVEEATDLSQDADGRRKYYRITASGRREMEAELQRLDRLVQDARSRRLIPNPRQA
jgi:DNA-binding PadR family transcriptional regulator